jgi:hypothetical protein
VSLAEGSPIPVTVMMPIAVIGLPAVWKVIAPPRLS